MFNNKTIILGVTSSIAAYKACDLVTALKREKAEVKVIMTKKATELVSPLTFKSLSKNTVYLDNYKDNEKITHISLAQEADLLVIAPATANIISQAACGIADDLLSTTILSAKSPVIFVPAMNTAMWEKEVIKENIRTLKKRGYIFVDPVKGYLACGDSGIGKMASLENIIETIKNTLEEKQDLKGLNILITAGGTKEKIDDVRYIGNSSSGKMGYCLAKEAHRRGAEVTLILGQSSVKQPQGVKTILIENGAQLKREVTKQLKENDVLIMTAAVADFKPLKKISGKIKREKMSKFDLPLVKTDDILKGVTKTNGKIIIGFSLGANGFIKDAKKKLKEKKVDFMVANKVDSLGSDEIDAVFLTKSSSHKWGKISKKLCARNILDKLKECMPK